MLVELIGIENIPNLCKIEEMEDLYAIIQQIFMGGEDLSSD